MLVDPFQVTSPQAGVPKSAIQQPIHAVVVRVKRVIVFTGEILGDERQGEPSGRRHPAHGAATFTAPSCGAKTSSAAPRTEWRICIRRGQALFRRAGR
jgi:hypothetical protein